MFAEYELNRAHTAFKYVVVLILCTIVTVFFFVVVVHIHVIALFSLLVIVVDIFFSVGPNKIEYFAAINLYNSSGRYIAFMAIRRDSETKRQRDRDSPHVCTYVHMYILYMFFHICIA